MFCLIYCFFFNDTSTTEIYTYCHTLSLHDALPILARQGRGQGFQGECPPATACGGCLLLYFALEPFPSPSVSRLQRQEPRSLEHRVGRSEEHTSELQSLMRISYAVFCLKQKKSHKYQHQPNLIRERRHTTTE